MSKELYDFQNRNLFTAPYFHRVALNVVATIHSGLVSLMVFGFALIVLVNIGGLEFTSGKVHFDWLSRSSQWMIVILMK